MRNVLLCLFVIFSQISCTNENKTRSAIHSPSIIPIKPDYDKEFNEWLKRQGYEKSSIYDTIAKKAYLWVYDDLNAEDSLLIWSPSKDSSFYLMTNYDKTKQNYLHDDALGIDFRFLDSKNKIVIIGFMILDSLKNYKIDYYWFDSETFYFIDATDETREKRLIKIKMRQDSIWSYPLRGAKL